MGIPADLGQQVPANRESYATIEARMLAFYDQLQMDGVQLNVNLGGDVDAWGSQYTTYGIGLDAADHPNQWGVALSGMVYEILPTDTYIDFYNYRIDYMLNTASIFPRYVTTDYKASWWNGTGYVPAGLTSVPGGTRSHPGVASIAPYSGYFEGYIEVPYMGRPVWFEMWFSENAQRQDPSIGYSGYTFFGWQAGTPFPSLYGLDSVPGSWVRRFVAGIFKRTADLATCTGEDVMCGCILTSADGVTSIASMYVNGILVRTATDINVTNVNAVSAWMDTQWEGLASDIVDTTPGAIAYYQMYGQDVNNVIVDVGTSMNPANESASYSLHTGIDTYDVKYGWYYDIPSDHPIGTPFFPPESSTPVTVATDTVAMYTHPGWPVSQTFPPSSPSTITNAPTTINTAVTSNEYELHAGNINTDHVNITSSGEIVVDGSSGQPDNILASSGAGYPVYWDTFNSDLASAEARMVPLTAP
jgi:hypothetical protein